MEIINNNPYRYLGVYSNSATKERVANQGKMKAFLKVGKSVSFPIDFPALLAPINRTTENVNEAISKLTLPSDQIKYAQFWWMKATLLDDMAFKHLEQGDIPMAESIWEKKTDTSSLQNRIVLALTQGKISSAISTAQVLYANHTSSFVENVMGGAVTQDPTVLIHVFLDEMIETGIQTSELLSHVTDADWKNYIEDKSIKPLIDSITQAIEGTKASKDKGPEARLTAGRKLTDFTRQALEQLKDLIPKNDVRYGTIADKLGQEILNCSIDYYNDSQDDDSPYKAQELLKYAQTVVVGQFAKDRCRENANTMDKIYDACSASYNAYNNNLL